MHFNTNFNADYYAAQYVDQELLFSSISRKISAAGKQTVELIASTINGDNVSSSLALPVKDGYVSAIAVQQYINGDVTDVQVRTDANTYITRKGEEVLTDLSDECRDQIALTQALEIIDSDNPSEALIQTITLYPGFASSSLTPIIGDIANTDGSKISKLNSLLSWLQPAQSEESQVTSNGITVKNIEASGFSGFRLWMNELDGIMDINFNWNSLADLWRITWRLNVYYPIVIGWKITLSLCNVLVKAVTKGLKWLKKTYITGTDRFSVEGISPYVNEGFFQGSMAYSGNLVKKLYDNQSILNVAVPGGRLMAWVTEEPEWYEEDEDAYWTGHINIGFKPQISEGSRSQFMGFPATGDQLEEDQFRFMCYDYGWTQPNFNPDTYFADANSDSIPAREGFGKHANEAGIGAIYVFYWWLVTRGYSDRYTDANVRAGWKSALNHDFCRYDGSTINLQRAQAGSEEYELVDYTIGLWRPNYAINDALFQLFLDMEEMADDQQWFLPYFYTYTTAYGDIKCKSDKIVANSVKNHIAITLAVIAAVSITVCAAVGWRKLQNAAIKAQRDYDVIAFDPDASPTQIRKSARKAARLSKFNPLSSSDDGAILYKLGQLISLIK